jgi:hypothetical protein
MTRVDLPSGVILHLRSAELAAYIVKHKGGTAAKES